jgi:hypothetical protein
LLIVTSLECFIGKSSAAQQHGTFLAWLSSSVTYSRPIKKQVIAFVRPHAAILHAAEENCNKVALF